MDTHPSRFSISFESFTADPEVFYLRGTLKITVFTSWTMNSASVFGIITRKRDTRSAINRNEQSSSLLVILLDSTPVVVLVMMLRAYLLLIAHNLFGIAQKKHWRI